MMATKADLSVSSIPASTPNLSPSLSPGCNTSFTTSSTSDSSNECSAYEALKVQIDKQYENYQTLHKKGNIGRMPDMYKRDKNEISDIREPSDTVSGFLRGGIVDIVACFERFLMDLLCEAQKCKGILDPNKPAKDFLKFHNFCEIYEENLKLSSKKSDGDGEIIMKPVFAKKPDKVIIVNLNEDEIEYTCTCIKKSLKTGPKCIHQSQATIELKPISMICETKESKFNQGKITIGNGNICETIPIKGDLDKGDKFPIIWTPTQHTSPTKYKYTDKNVQVTFEMTTQHGKQPSIKLYPSKTIWVHNKQKRDEYQMILEPKTKTEEYRFRVKCTSLTYQSSASFTDKLFDREIKHYHLIDDTNISELKIDKNMMCALFRLSYGIRCVMVHGDADRTLKYGVMEKFPICEKCSRNNHQDDPLNLQKITHISTAFDILVNEKGVGTAKVLKTSRKYPNPWPFPFSQYNLNNVERDIQHIFPDVKTVQKRTIREPPLDGAYALFHLCRIDHWLREGKRENMYITFNMLMRINQIISVLAHRIYITVARILIEQSDGKITKIWGVPNDDESVERMIDEFTKDHKGKVKKLQTISATLRPIRTCLQ